jgi:phosphate transport system substrate-binding protein
MAAIVAASAFAAALLCGSGIAADEKKDKGVKVDPKLAEYKETSGVSGGIKSVGSDTMKELMENWGEAFKRRYPAITIEIEDKGSATAPPALIKGTANFGPMSREMKPSEIDDFEKKFGYKPTGLKVAIDMLAVYVHKDNPIKELSLEQVDAIFSKNRKGGFEKDITTWGDLGLKGEWADRPISLYGRNAASGTNAFFKEHALFGGDYKATVKEQPGTAAVVKAVAEDKSGVGYGGIGYITADVRAVPIIGKGEKKAVEPTTENAYNGKYAMWRFLYVYVNHDPNKELDPFRREFVRFILSKEGQELVVKSGYDPITNVVAEKSLASVDLLKK